MNFNSLKRLMARTLLISLLLQSCGGGFNNPSIPIVEEQIASVQTNTQVILPQADIYPLFDQVLMANGGHKVTLYKEAGILKADVEMNTLQGFSRTYERLNVAVEQGAELTNLSILDIISQQRRIYLQLAQGDQPAKVIIYKGAGLLGRGKDKKNKKQVLPGEEEEEVQNEGDVKLNEGDVELIVNSNKSGQKGELGSKEDEYKKPRNSLPHISSEHRRLLSVLSKIRMREGQNNKASLFLHNIEEKVNEIRDYQDSEYLEDFYDAMKEAVREIRTTSSSLYELTKPYHHVLANTLQKLILDSIEEFERELNKRISMPIAEKEVLQLKTKRLYAEQSYIVRQAVLQKGLMKHLGEVKKLLIQPGKPSPYCYISYAWPSDENKKEEYWVQPFLSTLYNHLREAGVRMIMDIRDNKPGDSIYKFMKQYHDGNYIILTGTESLLAKHYSIRNHAVQTELSIISNRFEQDQRAYGYSRIYPLLISGTIASSFPEIYDKYRTVRDAREVGYLLMIRHLLDHLYEQRIDKEEGTNKVKLRYEGLWHAFNQEFQGLSNITDAKEVNEELSVGYHQQRLDALKGDIQFQSVQAQEATKHSSAVGAKMIGTLMESQGSNPKLLYSEYGQQFQRPSITPDFIERRGLWDKIVTHFGKTDNQILTLSAHGLGGMGKSELAKYYCLNPPRPYTLRAWFDADNKETLYTQYIDLAKENGIEYDEKMPIEEQARLIKSWLEAQKDCLLVYDNVPNFKHLEGLLPEGGKHHILITSRNEVAWPTHQRIDVDVMEEKEAIALICKITGCEEKAVGLKELVSTLQYMPLALVQAGAYIAAKKTSIAGYLDRYQKYQPIVMNHATLEHNSKHEPVWVTFNMNFKALKKKCPRALATLNQASWLSASAIPEILLESMLEGGKEDTLELLWDDIKEYIGKYSLMRIDSEGHKLSMHRLLQDILRSKQEEEESKIILKQVALSINDIYPDNDKPIESITLSRLLLPHIEATLSYLKDNFNEDDYTDFNLTFYLGNAYETIGVFIKAKEYYKSDLLMRQRDPTDNHPHMAVLLGSIGTVYNRLGGYQKALEYSEEALKIFKIIYPGNHPDIANSLNNIGNIYARLGNYQKALEYSEEALKMSKVIYTTNHPLVAVCFHSIGNIYSRLGNPQKALKYLEKALKIEKVTYPDNHPDIALSLYSIGIVYSSLGKHQKALEYLEKALKIFKVIYSNYHPDVAGLLSNIGNVYTSLCNYIKALKYHKEAFKIFKIIYPNNHPLIAGSFNNTGNVYTRLGNYQKALECYEEALKIFKIIYINNHPDIASSLNNIGNVYGILDDYQEALEYYEEAFKMSKAIYPNNHPLTAHSLGSIGNVYGRLGDYQKALEYSEGALKIFKIIHPGNHPLVANSLGNIGNVYTRLCNYPKALEYYKEAFKMRKAIYPNNHPDIAGSLGSIGNVYTKLGKYQKALKYLEKALEALNTTYAEYHPDIASSLGSMGNVYTRLGDYQKALEYYEEALKIEKVIYPTNHPDIAGSLGSIGNVYTRLGDYQKALKYLGKALKIERVIYVNNHSELASSLGSMGNVYTRLGDYQKALEYYEEALRMSKAIYPNNHPLIANSLGSIGNVYGSLGNYQKALKYLEKTLKIERVIYVNNHPELASSLGSIGNIYTRLGDYQKALEYYEEALKIFKIIYSDYHPDVASLLNNIGNVYEILGEFHTTLEYYEQALEMFTNLCPDNLNHPSIEMVKGSIARIKEVKENSVRFN